jgi:putative phosphonate transport system ATP-binding protein
MDKKPVLRLNKLNKKFGEGCNSCNDKEGSTLRKNYCTVCGTVYACKDISFELFSSEILGIVGESGSGKSTLMKCLYMDEEISSGELYIDCFKNGESNAFEESSQQKKMIRNMLMGKVYQNARDGLRIKFSSIANIAEKLIAAGIRNVSQMVDRGEELLRQVHIPDYRIKEPPQNFSGGMQQRVQIAKALSNNPPILLLDEVTTGLDLSVQASVLDIIKRIQRELSISMIVVSHDLAVIRMLSNRTLVMLDGKVVEHGLTDQVLEDPQHEYTQTLVHSLL